MKKPRKITLVPAHNRVQLGNAGTGRSFAVTEAVVKQSGPLDFFSTDRTKYLIGPSGQGKSHWLAKQREIDKLPRQLSTQKVQNHEKAPQNYPSPS
jgi:hypothetical protein